MGFPVSLIGVSSAGGIIAGPGAVTVTVNKIPVSLLGDVVLPHAPGKHLAATMVEGSGMFTVNGIPVVRTANRASCDHVADGFPAVTVAI